MMRLAFHGVVNGQWPAAAVLLGCCLLSTFDSTSAIRLSVRQPGNKSPFIEFSDDAVISRVNDHRTIIITTATSGFLGNG